MRAKRKRESELDGDLVDPAFNAALEEAEEPPNARGSQPDARGSQPGARGSQPDARGSQPDARGSQPDARGSQPNVRGSQPNVRGSQPDARGSQPNVRGSAPNPRASQPSASVLVGGGEKEARAYVPPTALPSLGPQEGDTTSKVAIASDVDPRRMPTVKIPEERKKKSAAGRPAPLDADGVPRPSKPGFSEAEAEGEDGTQTRARGGKSPMVIWAVAVALAAVLGAGAAYGVRKGMRKDAPSGEPAKTAPVKR